MIVDIVFKRLVPKVDGDCFTVVAQADGGVDGGCCAYFIEDVACGKCIVLVWTKGDGMGTHRGMYRS
jgi:hypothetical protein